MKISPIPTALVAAALALPLLAGGAPAQGKKSPLINHTGWSARVDRTQPSPARLVIAAKLTLPTPGYKASLKLRRAYTANPPIPVYELVLTPPTKIVTQVVTTLDFRHVEPLPGPEYRVVVIVHAGKQIARLTVKGSRGARLRAPRPPTSSCPPDC